MAGNIYGLDLGTYEIKIYDKKRNQIKCEKNVIAMQERKYIFAAGDRAYEIYEKAPSDIQVVFPMKDGVIARFDDMQYLLGKLLGKERRFIGGAQYVIAVPTDVTEVEKKAFYDLVLHSEARARTVRVVERGLADAVGAGVDVMSEKGALIANFGGDTTELSVLSCGGMVVNRLMKTGGHDCDKAIVSRVRHDLEFLIGNSTAELLRKRFGISGGRAECMQVSGRDLITGIPVQKNIPAGLVCGSVRETLEACAGAVRSILERIPPDVRRAVEEKGIYLTGGMARLKGMAAWLRESTGLPVMIPKKPELCAVKGLCKIISDRAVYNRLTYSMRDEDYRWLR